MGTWKVNNHVVLDLSSLLLRWYILSGKLLMSCKPLSTNLSIILKELLGFSSSVSRGFYKGISCFLWLIYGAKIYGWLMWLIYLWDLHVVDIFMRFTCGWYIHMWLIYEIHVLKLFDKSFTVQESLILLKHQHGIRS